MSDVIIKVRAHGGDEDIILPRKRWESILRQGVAGPPRLLHVPVKAFLSATDAYGRILLHGVLNREEDGYACMEFLPGTVLKDRRVRITVKGPPDAPVGGMLDISQYIRRIGRLVVEAGGESS